MLKITLWIRQVKKVQSLNFGHFLTNLVIFRLSFSHFYWRFSFFYVIRAGWPIYFVKRKKLYENLIPLERLCQEKCCDFLRPWPQYGFRNHPTHHFPFKLLLLDTPNCFESPTVAKVAKSRKFFLDKNFLKGLKFHVKKIFQWNM